jgi:hypothetical protein
MVFRPAAFGTRKGTPQSRRKSRCRSRCNPFWPGRERERLRVPLIELPGEDSRPLDFTNPIHYFSQIPRLTE